MIILILTLVGSWIVPIATLLISWKVTRLYLEKLRNEARMVGNKAQEAACISADRVLKQIPTPGDISRAVNRAIPPYPDVPDVEAIMKTQIPDLTKSINQSIDGKLGNILRQVHEAARHEVETEVKNLREEYEENEPMNIGKGLLSLFLR